MNKARRTILVLLREKSPDYGIGLVKRSEGKLRRGTVYVHLRRLEDDGFVNSFVDPNEKPVMVDDKVILVFGKPFLRRKYELTGTGRQKLLDIESERGGLLDGLPEGSPA